MENKEQIGYGKGMFTLDENGCPVKLYKGKKDRRVCDERLDRREDKKLNRRGVEVCTQ